MPELSVVVLTTDEEQKALLPVLVDGTAIARMTHSYDVYPESDSDPLMRRIQELKTDVVLVDLVPDKVAAALHAIELLRAACPKSAVFALGEMTRPQLIVDSMRAGAGEFFARPPSTDQLLDGFNRLVSSRRKVRSSGTRGRVFVVLNAKGGNGATTVAVNTALAIANSRGSTALLDMAPVGDVPLHLNLKTPFSIMDALNNLHRLDATLLDGFMARHETGLHVLAGHTSLGSTETKAADFARLFDVIVGQYRHVVVDVSTRLDPITHALCDLSDAVLLVANPDLASLWSATRVREFLLGSPAERKLQLVMNRYRKITGFGESEIEHTTQAKILYKIPNKYAPIIAAIERGVPVAQTNHSDIARYFVDFGDLLLAEEQVAKSSTAKTTARLFPGLSRG